LDFVEGVGLGGFPVVMLLSVAETGILGGGIESCLTPYGSLFSGIEWLPLPLDALRFQDKLNFRLNELLIDEGVGGSSGLDNGGEAFVEGALVVAVAAVVIGFGAARGPDGFWWCTGSTMGSSVML
jgi:hypothetical protein